MRRFTTHPTVIVLLLALCYRAIDGEWVCSKGESNGGCDGNVEQLESDMQDLEARVAEAMERLESLENRTAPSAAPVEAISCRTRYLAGETTDGVYQVELSDGTMINAFCDMTTEPGGWTVIQRREDGSVDFKVGWASYKAGFGSLTGEHWLGNDNIHGLAANGGVTIRFDMMDKSGATAFAMYPGFMVADESAEYYMNFTGPYSGDAGDSFEYHNGYTFATIDQGEKDDCADDYNGGWWYRSCHTVNFNGLYGDDINSEGINWYGWKGYEHSLPMVEMKIMPGEIISDIVEADYTYEYEY